MENFELKKAKELSPSELNTYITKYFYPLANGNHVMIQHNVPVIYKKEIIKHTYFARLPKKANDFYFTENCDIKEIVCEIGQPMIQSNSINVCPQFLHKVKPYSEFSDVAKTGVNMMLEYVKEIWASGRADAFDFLIKWFANMARGNKNTSILYCKSIQGTGKSTLTDFFMKHVIGPNLSLMSGSEPIKTRFNSTLLAKLLVVFEELENSGVNEWQTISSNLKRHATSNTINIESKGIDSYITNNINNYIINTNVDAIKDSEGRRYFIVEINPKRKGDFAFFSKIRDTCFNNEVGEAFFSYLHEIDLTKYNAEGFPESASKVDAVISRLDNAYMFLKEIYVLKDMSVNSTVTELYEKYLEFCTDSNLKSQSKINFNQKMKDINIVYYKSNAALKYKVSHPDLLAIAHKNKWINELDEYDMDKVKVVTPSVLKSNEYTDMVTEIADLKREIERLKKQPVQVPENTEDKYAFIINDFKKTVSQKSKPKVKQPEVKRQVITSNEIESVYDLFN